VVEAPLPTGMAPPPAPAAPPPPPAVRSSVWDGMDDLNTQEYCRRLEEMTPSQMLSRYLAPAPDRWVPFNPEYALATPPEAAGQVQPNVAQGVPPPVEEAPQLDQELLYIGNQPVDASHAVWHTKGLFWCHRCGKYGSRVLRALKDTCRGPPPRSNRSAWTVLNRLRGGDMPRPGFVIPIPHGGPPDGPWMY
jgi:hypothetical protein